MKGFVAALLFASLAAPVAVAAELPEGKWWKRPRIAAEINLTADQTREIEGIFTRSRPRLIDLKADLEKKQGDLQDALDDPNADRRTIAARVEAVEDARGELQKTRILMVLDMKQVLKPDQWDRLVRMQQEFRQQRRERFDRFLERRRPLRQPR
jgi:Spy/CpxP family protein refolding chaperone